MTIDVVNGENHKVGSLDLSDDVFGGRVRTDLIWEAVVHANAADRRGTHATKTRGVVAGSGRKLWKQKGTGRARTSDLRNPLWRKGGTVFGPQPRDYGYNLPKKVRRGALRDSLSLKLREGAVKVVDELAVKEPRTRHAAALLKGLGAGRRTLLVDVRPDELFARSTRNLAGVVLVPSSRVTARDVMGAASIIATRAAMEHLARVLGPEVPADRSAER